MGEPEVTVRDEPTRHRFEILVGGTVAGFTRYKQEGDSVALVHTEVDDAYEGQGLGSRLVAAVLDELRGRGVAVLPYCPFVQGYLKRHPERLDQVPVADRERLGLA
jgi:predicted GNAT family acetyltransferase